MKKLYCSLLLMLFCLGLVSLPVMAAETDDELGFWFEGQVISNGLSRIIGSYEHNLTDSFGYYVLVEMESNGYREAYAGPKWKLLSWLEIGVGIGRETAPDMPDSVRRNAFFDANWEKAAISGTFENGGSGPWHNVTAVYRVTEKIGVGAMDETGLGFGPRAEYHIAENVTVWGAILHTSHGGDDKDSKKTVSMLAINFSF